MPKSTTTYWNPLSLGNREQWRTIRIARMRVMVSSGVSLGMSIDLFMEEIAG
ncbi:MAG: hypothetical protein U0236_21130 [Nitrospira sp.]